MTEFETLRPTKGKPYFIQGESRMMRKIDISHSDKVKIATDYTSDVRIMKDIVRKHWPVLTSDPHIRELVGEEPVFCYRNKKSLKWHLCYASKEKKAKEKEEHVGTIPCDALKLKYSVYEEQGNGYVISDIGNDIGLDPQTLKTRRARTVSEGGTQYFEINLNNGMLLGKENIDRDEVCGQSSPCRLYFQVIIENPLHLYEGEVEILDLNDNAPRFRKKMYVLEINEFTALGTRYSLEKAQDLDVGINAVQDYQVTQSEYFQMNTQTGIDGNKYAELVLVKQLDYEKIDTIILHLIARDGGNPQRTGTTEVHITVLDANDNYPVFNQTVYRIRLAENTAKDFVALKVTATDLDEGLYGEIEYSFSRISNANTKKFKLNEQTGEIKVAEMLDYEDNKVHEMEVQAEDGGGLTAHCKVVFEIIDMNDNAPEIVVSSITSPLPENSSPPTVIALLSVRDRDDGENGKVHCSVIDQQPFKLIPSLKNFYELISVEQLDREENSDYNITIVAVDGGSPPLSCTTVIHLQVSDVNDNPPIFTQTSYIIYTKENNNPGSFIDSVKAFDSDSNHNAQIVYKAVGNQALGLSLSSLISVNWDTGDIYATRSFDYEKITHFQFLIKAQDSGSPPLNATVPVTIHILDENDNAPTILHPLPNNSHLATEIVPVAADAGHVVTKVVAVDADSGQNAWLSFQLLKATDPSLFTVGVHTGEIRTARQTTAKDGNTHRLIVVVKDNGQPQLSSTASLNILVAEHFSGAYLENADVENLEDYDQRLTVYLIISLCVISSLFLAGLLVLLSLKAYRVYSRRHCVSSGLKFTTSGYLDCGGKESLPRNHFHEVCSTTEIQNPERQRSRIINQHGSVTREENHLSHVLVDISSKQEAISSMLSEKYWTSMLDYQDYLKVIQEAVQALTPQTL
ncbi:protocadherin beta-15-like [Protopterus annectens]|uniref:protocadherin beta-15-like n=1 Tax=Protopterus annectens TaxID=7888 RepID=UPI001CFC02EA|nr:protocadherin beta-15-like [Protopterus annectens]